jgi:hypothetical protein
MARALLPKDAGFALHILTGYEQRSCYRYARGERPAPADLLRALMRGDGGETFLNFVLDGAPWWVERQKQIACASAYEKKRREIECGAPATQRLNQGDDNAQRLSR